MDFFTGLRVASTGLSVQRTRMNITSSNLANAETTRTAVVERSKVWKQAFHSTHTHVFTCFGTRTSVLFRFGTVGRLT